MLLFLTKMGEQFILWSPANNKKVLKVYKILNMCKEKGRRVARSLYDVGFQAVGTQDKPKSQLTFLQG